MPKQFYHYIIRPGAITQVFSNKEMDYLKAVRIVEDFLKKEGIWNKFQHVVYEFYLYHIFYNLSIRCAYISAKKERNVAFDQLHENLRDYKVSWRKVKSTMRNGTLLWGQITIAKKLYYKLFWNFPFALKQTINVYHAIRYK